MKKLIFLIFVFNINVFLLGHPNYWHEITGGISWHLMNDYNNSINKLKEDFASLGAVPYLNQLSQGASYDFSTCNKNTLYENFVAYLRWGFIILNDNESYINFSPTIPKKFLLLNSSFNNSYIGIGFRYYLPKSENVKYELEKNFNIFFGVDFCLFGLFSYQYMFFEFYDINGSYIGNLLWEAENNLFFGSHIEAGIDYWFNDWIGFIFKLGYRIASIEIKGNIKTTGIVSEYLSIQSLKQKAEYDGFYILFGINFSLEPFFEKKPQEKNKQ